MDHYWEERAKRSVERYDDLEDTLVQQEEAQRMQNLLDQFADEPEV